MKKLSAILFLFLAISACKKENADTSILYEDDLKTDKQTWPVSSGSYYTRGFSNGHYTMWLDRESWLLYAPAPYGTVNFPYSVQVDATIQPSDQSKLGKAGLLFNYIDGDNYCVLQIASNGTFRLEQNEQGNLAVVLPTTVCTAIKTSIGAVNTIKVTQRATSVEFRINNVVVGSYALHAPTAYCKMGPAIATSNDNYFTPTTAQFNNFVIRKL